jgi:TetR/AcrR family transcriptional repressor of nem operon
MTEPAKKYSKKEEIMWIAADIFRQNGYHNTSISDLAKACGLHNAHFYYYFKDKENLLEESLGYLTNYFDKKVFQIAFQEGLSAKEKGVLMLETTKKVFLHNQGGCIMANITLETAQYNTRFIPVIQNFFNKWTEALKHIYQEKYQPQKAQEKAEQAIQDIEGGILLMRLYKNDKYFLNALQRASEVLN